jgi:hypothetical protein
MRQHIHEYLKTSIYRSIVNSKDGLTAENIKKKVSVTIENSEEFDACMKELKDYGLIMYNNTTELWTAI